jgi:hypothetical protein
VNNKIWYKQTERGEHHTSVYDATVGSMICTAVCQFQHTRARTYTFWMCDLDRIIASTPIGFIGHANLTALEYQFVASLNIEWCTMQLV